MDEESLEARLSRVNEQLRVASDIINKREDTLWRQGRKVEYLLIVGSLVAAYSLMIPPPSFGFSQTYEFSLGLFVLVAAGLKIISFVLHQTGAFSLSNLIRLISFSLSSVFWVTLGVTTMAVYGTPLCGLGSIMIGIISSIMFGRLARSRWWNV